MIEGWAYWYLEHFETIFWTGLKWAALVDLVLALTGLALYVMRRRNNRNHNQGGASD